MSGEITLQSIVKRYGDVVAVDDVSQEMPGGEFFTMLGPSGCGKTTTLRLIAGFEKLDAGAVLLDGVDVSGRPPHKRPLNTVFQSYALFPHMTVADNVAFGLRYQRVTKAEKARRVGEAMSRVQLSGLEAPRPGPLSGGHQERGAPPPAALPGGQRQGGPRPRAPGRAARRAPPAEPGAALDGRLRVDLQVE